MKTQPILRWLGVLGLGVALAAWWFSPERIAGGPPGTSTVARSVDWGDLQEDFTIRNVHVVMKSDRRISDKPFPVLAFDVTARQECPGRFYMARFYDADGVELGPVVGTDGKAHQRTMGLVQFQPDYAVEQPWKWLPGVRSHGWILLPDDLHNESLPKLHKIVVKRASF